MTVCGGPREENPTCVEENPTCVEGNPTCVDGNPMCVGGESHWLGLLLLLAKEVSSSSTSEPIIA